MECVLVPSLFKCPISLELMKDPVTLCTGITYDRESIGRWFHEGHFSCPSTMQALDTLELTPNHTVKRLIQGWCCSNAGHGTGKISTREPTNDKEIEEVLLGIRNSPTEFGYLRNLADLARKSGRNRTSIVALGGPAVLIHVLSRTRKEAEHIMCGEAALAILAGIPIHEAKEECIRIVKSSINLDSICWFLCKGSFRARFHSAQVLHGLLSSDQNLKAVLKPDEEVFKNLALLLREVRTSAIKTALEILVMISPVRRNRIRAVEAGVAIAVIEILPEADRNIGEKALVVLEILCQCAEGRASVCGHPLGIPVLAKKMARVSELATDAATGALWQISKNCRTPSVLEDMEESGAYVKLLLVLQIGCSSTTRQRAEDILRSYKKGLRKVNLRCLFTDEFNERALKLEDIHLAKLTA